LKEKGGVEEARRGESNIIKRGDKYETKEEVKRK
jgi:hypothetical protein